MYHFFNIVTFSLEVIKKKNELSYFLNFNLNIEQYFFIILFIYKYYLITKKKRIKYFILITIQLHQTLINHSPQSTHRYNNIIYYIIYLKKTSRLFDLNVSLNSGLSVVYLTSRLIIL